MKRCLFLALCGLGLAGCSSSAQKESIEATVAQGPATEVAAPVASPAAAPIADSSSADGVAANPSPHPEAADRLVVYRGTLSLTVDSFEQASARIDQLLATHHAYLDSAHETRSAEEHQQDMTIKVRPDQFAPLVTALGRLGRINQKDITSSDVTADVLDGSAGVQAAQASATQLRQLLARTTDAAQVRRLHGQLSQAEQEASATQARLRSTREQARWAVLRLHLTQLLPADEPTAPLPAFQPRWQAAFNTGWAAVLAVVVAFTHVWPLLVLGVAGAVGMRYWRLRHPAPTE